MAANTRCFTTDSRFVISGRLLTFRLRNEANRVRLRCGSRVRLTSFRRTDCSIPRLLRLHVERAIYMVNSFPFTRSARLILAHRSRGERRGEESSKSKPESAEAAEAMGAAATQVLTLFFPLLPLRVFLRRKKLARTRERYNRT